MIAMIAAIAELFFSAIAAITAMVAIIWKPGLKEEKKINHALLNCTEIVPFCFVFRQ